MGLRVRFGVRLPSNGESEAPENSARSLIKVAKEAEAFGYSSAWCDDFLVIQEHKPYLLYDPIVTLSFVASVTTHLKLGTSCIGVPLRPNAGILRLAKQAATLDDLSGGRLIFGVCAGSAGAGAEGNLDYGAVGVPPETKGRRLDEGIQALKALWTEPSASFDGEYYKFSDVNLTPRPKQKPHPPIWIAGGSKYTLRRVAKTGDGWITSGSTPEEIKENLAMLKKYAKRYGREYEKIEINNNIHTGVAKTSEEAYNYIMRSPHYNKYIAPRVRAQALSRGVTEEEAKKRYFSRWWIGTPREISDKLEKNVQEGVTHFLIRFTAPTFEKHLEEIRLFGTEVIQSFS